MHAQGQTYLLQSKDSFMEIFFTTFEEKISKKFFYTFHKVKLRSGAKGYLVKFPRGEFFV